MRSPKSAGAIPARKLFTIEATFNYCNKQYSHDRRFAEIAPNAIEATNQLLKYYADKYPHFDFEITSVYERV